MSAAMTSEQATERLSMWQAATVVARRDFTAILFSRSFIFFLLGPLFPAIIFLLAGGIGAAAAENRVPPAIAVQMVEQDALKLQVAHERAREQLGERIPAFRFIEGEDASAEKLSAMLRDAKGEIGATLTGSLADPVLTGTEDRLGAWRGIVAMQLAAARDDGQFAYPTLKTETVQTSGATQKRSRQQTAQAAMTLLFLLMMLLAGMVLSNLVEEKANKIIEILAAALPMDSVFFGKLFAMLGVSLVGLAVWGSTIGLAVLAFGDVGGLAAILAALPTPGVGWPLFCVLFVVYFSMGYLLIGSIFLAIGALASTVREVQTLSMPVTMLQLLVFFFASFVLLDGANAWQWLAILFPLSSPFAMLALGAQQEAVWTHLAALAYQAVWVAIFIRLGAAMFRKRVMQSGPARVGGSRWAFWRRQQVS